MAIVLNRPQQPESEDTANGTDEYENDDFANDSGTEVFPQHLATHFSMSNRPRHMPAIIRCGIMVCESLPIPNVVQEYCFLMFLLTFGGVAARMAFDVCALFIDFINQTLPYILKCALGIFFTVLMIVYCYACRLVCQRYPKKSGPTKM